MEASLSRPARGLITIVLQILRDVRQVKRDVVDGAFECSADRGEVTGAYRAANKTANRARETSRWATIAEENRLVNGLRKRSLDLGLDFLEADVRVRDPSVRDRNQNRKLIGSDVANCYSRRNAG